MVTTMTFGGARTKSERNSMDPTTLCSCVRVIMTESVTIECFNVEPGGVPKREDRRRGHDPTIGSLVSTTHCCCHQSVLLRQ